MRAFSLGPGLPGLILHALAPVRQPAALARLRRSLTRSAALIGCLLLTLTSGPAACADTPLVFGVFPNLTARQTIVTYRPLADVLERHLQRRVILFSARNFKTFVERTRQGEYDILLTAPHLAWLARQDAGYRPLLKYAQPARGLLVVKADSPFAEPAALRGRTIATPDLIAVAVSP